MQKIKRDVQQGFTVIELTIVIAIVAILVALVVPAYQNYTVRSKVIECINAAAPLKIAASEYEISSGRGPTAEEMGARAGDGYGATEECGEILIRDYSGVITVTSTVGPGGISVKLTPTETVDGTHNWVCSNGGNVNTAKYLPSDCRSGGTT